MRPMPLLARLQAWARRLRRDVVTVYFAARDPRTPWPARLLALGVAGYALSPIDLIPDFIPILGWLDDLILVPLGLMLVLRLLPAPVLDAARAKAVTALERPRSAVAATVVVCAWLACAAAGAYAWLRHVET